MNIKLAEMVSSLVSTPDVCGGRLRIEGTRITLNQIVTLYKQGRNAEDIADEYPHISLAQVYSALAYYHANRTAVEADLEAEKVEAQEMCNRMNLIPDSRILIPNNKIAA